MKCERVREEIKAYIDGELGLLAQWTVKRHLATCPECRTQEDYMKQLTEDVRNVEQVTVPAGLRGKVLEGIEFEPQNLAKKRLQVPVWAAAAAVVLVVMFSAAAIFPIFITARESSRMVSAKANMKELGQPLALARPAMPESASEGGRELRVQSVPTPAPDRASDDIRPSATPLMIIKTGELTVSVRDFQPAYDLAVRIATSVGGYVTDSSASTEGSSPTSGNLTMRVPALSFERTVERLSKLGTVKSRTVNGQDVTGEAVDLESRLRNKRAEERQYLEIMNRAKRVPDIVTVTEELSRVRGEIEEVQGRLKHLKSAAAMSTINIQFSEPGKAPKNQSAIGGTLHDATASFVGTLSRLASAAIWLVIYSPFWALPLGAILYVRKRWPSETE